MKIKNLFDYLFAQLSDVYPYDTMGRHNKTVIDIGDIRIDFRCGDIYKLGGLRPDYYNTDSQLASDFLCQGAVKCDGKELADISDILRIIATHNISEIITFYILKGEKIMSMQTWAEKEIEIGCKREREASGIQDDGDWDYGCACYESALKAYKSLMGDGHSGFSIGMTKHILNRLIDGKPLTPIEDTPDVWNDVSYDDEYTMYQCTRMSSLFKYVYIDGSVKYKNIDSFYCIDINNQSTYHNGMVGDIINEMFPISMPYMPEEPIKVYCEDFLVDEKNGDYDTKGVFYMVKPDGEKIEINRFFKESKDGWNEIDEAEYDERKAVKIA